MLSRQLPTLYLFFFAVSVFAQLQEISMDSATTTYNSLPVSRVSTVPSGAVVYSYSTPSPSDTPILLTDFMPSFTDPVDSEFMPLSTDSAEFMPPPPQIFPTWAIPTTSASSSPSSPNVGAIIGAVVGAVVLLAAAIAAIFYFRCRKGSSRNKLGRSPRGSWQDLEGKGYGAAALPGTRDQAKMEPSTEDNYTHYPFRGQGRFSALPKTASPAVHSPSDPFSDSQAAAQHSGGFSDDEDSIEMRVNPASPVGTQRQFDWERNV
ncbi:hypothetical protein FPV67DRAFT_1668069 [Lyophyllum atratum]|nr:hypothetical protein FPV67DRAFT_1668069 [Lyophyllum atratum]